MVVPPPSCLRREDPSTMSSSSSSSSCRNMTSPGDQCAWTTCLSPPGPLSELWFRTRTSVSSSSSSTSSSSSVSTTSSTTTATSTSMSHDQPPHHHPKKQKKVSFKNECHIHEYTLVEWTPQQRSTLWWDAIELDHFRSKRKARRERDRERERSITLLPPSMVVSSRLWSSSLSLRRRSRADSTQPDEPSTRRSPSSVRVVDDRRPVPDPHGPPPPPPLQTADPRHCSHPRQVVYVYRVYKDDDDDDEEGVVEGEKETGSELVRQFSRRSSKLARDKAHRRAVVLSQSMGTYYGTAAAAAAAAMTSSSSYPLLQQNRFLGGLSSRLTDVYLESLLETIERNWLCGGGTGGTTGSRTWGMEQESRVMAAA